ncbi:hypothetical protein [uncultured Sphingomonas sp.]|uniref:hypothetical protein n=1 Tax=uncultured Sphingomonas sp. TaxID=158754 RepID=UPI0025D8F475|nr:hypothetical protein [uncultured Sphingomonas sp.]
MLRRHHVGDILARDAADDLVGHIAERCGGERQVAHAPVGGTHVDAAADRRLAILTGAHQWPFGRRDLLAGMRPIALEMPVIRDRADVGKMADDRDVRGIGAQKTPVAIRDHDARWQGVEHRGEHRLLAPRRFLDGAKPRRIGDADEEKRLVDEAAEDGLLRADPCVAILLLLREVRHVDCRRIFDSAQVLA